MRKYVTRFKCELPDKIISMEIMNRATTPKKAEALAIEEAEEWGAWIGNQSVEWTLVGTKLKA